MRRVLTCVVVVAAAAACSRAPEPEGPHAPHSIGYLAVDDARIAGQARAVTLAFLEAYANAPTDRGRALARLMEGVIGQQWAHWVAVQNASFPGEIEGELELGHLGRALPVRADDGSLDDVVAYGVSVRATVVFTLTNEEGELLPDLRRVMNGLIVVVQGEDGRLRVLNFVRDNRRLDQFFQVFDGALERRNGVTVEVKNLVQLERWQFGVQITNDTERPLRVVPRLTALLTAEQRPATPGQPLVSFARAIRPGESAEGIVSFAAPEQTAELDLQIAVAGPGGEPTGFVFGVPEPVGDAAASPSPSA
jgi:hypothetical protein